MPDRKIAEDHYFTALDLYAEGRVEDSVSEYEKAIAVDPSLTDALHGLSRAFQDLGRMDDAITISQKIAQQDPEDILAHTSLSILYQKKGMVPEAEAAANQARILGWKQQLRAQKNAK